MNSRGEFKITSMLMGILLAFGLFFTMIATTFTSLGGVYDTTSYDESDLTSYNHLAELNKTLQERGKQIDDGVSVDRNAFDYLANIFKDVLEPFKFIYRSYQTLFTVSNEAVIDLKLFDEFRVWAQAVLITLVLIGVVMFTIYLKVRK